MRVVLEPGERLEVTFVDDNMEECINELAIEYAGSGEVVKVLNDFDPDVLPALLVEVVKYD